jgi:hypothetical protein
MLREPDVTALADCIATPVANVLEGNDVPCAETVETEEAALLARSLAAQR